ncbi:hypothetical protein Scep_019129 [Stephania cephalantha]|uniref:Uncharacterized protein n=1 Tax=Stephania cephalantha TaxID=152367 RepID=A0AAP0NMY8_9MAGN
MLSFIDSLLLSFALRFKGADGGGRSSCEDEPDVTAITASGAAQRSGKSGRRAVAWMAVIARSSDASNAARRPAVGSAPAGRRHSRSDEIGGQLRTSRRGGVEQRLRASSRVAARRGERCQHGGVIGGDRTAAAASSRISGAEGRTSGSYRQRWRARAAPASGRRRRRRGSGSDAVAAATR